MPADDLCRTHAVGAAGLIVDVRSPLEYATGHLPESINIPETQVPELVRILGRLGSATLVCNDGRLGAAVCRAVCFCGIADVFFLDGGLEGWAKAGGALVETSPTGEERPQAEPPPPLPWFRRLVLGLAVSALAFAAVLFLVLR